MHTQQCLGGAQASGEPYSAPGMADRTQAVLVLLACSAVLATGSAADNLAAHNASAELLGAGATKLLFPSANTSDSTASYELAYARAQLYRVSALLPAVQLRPGVPVRTLNAEPPYNTHPATRTH